MRILMGLMALVLMFDASATTNSSARIDGITQFLVDRANETYFYVFEKKMQAHPLFQCYFPETYSYIKEGDLKALIKSRDIWQESMDMDFETLVVRTIAKGIDQSADLHKLAMGVTNEYAELVQFLTIKINGQPQALDFMPLNASVETRNIINGFYDDFNKLRNNMLSLNAELSIYGDVCSSTVPSKEDMVAKLKELDVAFKGLKNWIEHIKAHKSRIGVDKQKIEMECQTHPDLAICEMKDKIVDKLVTRIKQSIEKPVVKGLVYTAAITKYIKNIERRSTYTGRVIEAFKVIKDEKIEANNKLKELKTYLLFIAQVADSETSDQVSNLLREYALPVTSYLAKREPDSNRMMISSYFGYAGGAVTNDNKIDGDNVSGFYVPIGLEYSHGLSKGASISVMLSPVDFAYPVNLKLNGVEEGVELDEIVAPSISLAYGIKDYPVNIGIAFQKGKRFSLQNQEEKRILFFVAFDMPLFSF